MKYLGSIVAVICLLQQTMAASPNQVAKASNTFADKLYEKVAKEPGNVLVCPISLHVALGLVLQGAGSNTSTELASVLGFSGVNDDIKDSYQSLLTGIKDDTLKIATKLYPAANYELSASYVSLAQKYFLSDVEGVDYSKPDEASQKINKYVEEHTNNKIHDLISPDSISDLTKLVVVNAVHFQATWKKTFTTAYDDYFKVTPTEKVLTKMMSMTDFFHYKEDPALDAKILKMDYTDGGYSMVFVLPNKEDGLHAVEEKLGSTDLSSLLQGLKETKVEVTIPKFKLEKTIKLKDILTEMGLKDLFTSRADLHGIANGDNLYVSDVIQKTFINVHENGTEAAAATGFLIELLSASFDTVMFSARWPFHFTLIRNQRPRMRLFDGRLVRPSQDRNPQESNQLNQNSDEEKITFSEGLSETEKNIVNSLHKIDQEFKPDLFNNKNTISQASSYPHQPHITQEQHSNNFHNAQPTNTQSLQSNTKDSETKRTDYNGQKPLHQSQNIKPINQNSNNEPQTQYAMSQSNAEEDDAIKYPDYIEQQPPNHIHTVRPVHQKPNNVPQTKHTTTQPDQQQAPNDVQNNDDTEQKPHHQSLNNENVNQNSNNVPQAHHTITQSDQPHTEKDNGQNQDQIRKKPHHQPSNIKPVNQHSNNVPQAQHTTTQSDQPHRDNDNGQNQDQSRKKPHHQPPNIKPVNQNSNILPQTQYVTPKSDQLSTEDYIRRNQQFALQLQEFYRQRYQIPIILPYQNVY